MPTTQPARRHGTTADIRLAFGPLIMSVSERQQRTCMVLIDSTVYRWGSNATDQLRGGRGATSIVPCATVLGSVV